MKPDDISRIRRFNRAVTTEIGALDTSFLGRGRPLGAARLLHAIGHGETDVGNLRRKLDLDSGLTSRLLRSLEAEGLIEVRPDPTDRRRRIARTTPEGKAEVASYDRLSDRRARNLVQAQGRNAQALMDAMDLVATALGRDRIDIEPADPQSEPARYCLDRYYADLAQRFDTGFDPAQSLDPDARDMRPPRGTFLIAMSDELPVGCVGLKGQGTDTAEIKRLWVAPVARGLGLARRLMQEAEDHARAIGITTLRLDTNRALQQAINLYRATGWTEVPAFNAEPYAHHWFEKRLTPGAG